MTSDTATPAAPAASLPPVASLAPAPPAAPARPTVPEAQALPWPDIDFSQFGDTERVPLSRTQLYVGAALARNWRMIPHVTHHDDIEITAAEACRLRQAQGEASAKITMLSLLIKAVVAALQAYPQFNASLDASGRNLILKKYFHIGIAVDVPQGLLVPVLRDCDTKSAAQLAGELTAITARARAKGLPMSDMTGGCFSISSLGGIGGVGFTPIINAPECAILGVGRARKQVAWDGESLRNELMLPLSLSYDHRVINGADAARFTRHISHSLAAVEGLPG